MNILLTNWRIGGYLGVVGLEKWWFRQQQLEVPQGVDIPRGKMISIDSHWVLVVVVLLCWVPIGYNEITHRLGIIVDLYMGCPCTWSSIMWCESDFSAWQLGDCPLSEVLCKCFVRSFKIIPDFGTIHHTHTYIYIRVYIIISIVY